MQADENIWTVQATNLIARFNSSGPSEEQNNNLCQYSLLHIVRYRGFIPTSIRCQTIILIKKKFHPDLTPAFLHFEFHCRKPNNFFL